MLFSVREFFHSMMAVLNRWEPLCFLQGRSGRGGLFWVLFWAVAKEYLARGANTAMPNKKHQVNAIKYPYSDEAEDSFNCFPLYRVYKTVPVKNTRLVKMT